MKILKSLVLLLVFLAGGCSLDYEKDQTTPADQVPQLVFDHLRQTGVKDGRILYTMESDVAEVYQTKKQMRLKRFRFQEYDSHGASASQGEADEAAIDTVTNDAKISGRLKARSEEHRVTLEVGGGSSGSLTWANEDRILKTEQNAAVRLLKDDGSKIEASGLTLDLGSNKLELEDGVRGTWTPETKQDANTVAPSPPVPGSPY